ncbi:hypothetical protein DOE73_00955 [Paenibacillus dendritiformis]|nr:hypothetical protein DOE73_00955 [Paenibacillus dendritiformis]
MVLRNMKTVIFLKNGQGRDGSGIKTPGAHAGSRKVKEGVRGPGMLAGTRRTREARMKKERGGGILAGTRNKNEMNGGTRGKYELEKR